MGAPPPRRPKHTPPMPSPIQIGTLAAIAATLLIAIYLVVPASMWLAVDGSTTASSTKCNDGNVCTFDKLTGSPGYCEHYAYSTDKTCASSCYATGAKTHCDGNLGVCTGAASACNGYCGVERYTYDNETEVCDVSLFPIAHYFAFGTANGAVQFPLSNFTGAKEGMYCLADNCYRVFVQATFYDNALETSILPTAGAFIPCADSLDTQQTTVDLSCIVAEEYKLDSLFVSAFFNNTKSDQGAWIGRACVFSYACGVANETLLNLPEVAGKRTALAPRGDKLAVFDADIQDTLRTMSVYVGAEKKKKRALMKMNVA